MRASSSSIFERLASNVAGSTTLPRIAVSGHSVTLHAADAIFGDEFRNIGSNVAEIAERSGGWGDDAPSNLVVSFEAFFSSAVVICTDNARVEVLDIDNIHSDVFCELFNRYIDSFVH